MHLDKEATARLRAILSGLTRPVTVILFTQEAACAPCREQQGLLRTIAELSPRLNLEIRDLVADAELATQHGVMDRAPATLVVGPDKRHGIRFFGVTSGYELGSLVEALVMVGTGRSGLPQELERLALLIDRPVHLEVMVTLTCPYCPRMVQLAHQLAFVNDRIVADMIDAAEFPQLVQRYDVHGVPRTVIDGRPAFEGALPAPQAILRILAATNPEAHERVASAIHKRRGEPPQSAVDPAHLYDTIIVGAGPAGLSAALYAARKNVDVALLGEVPGGQLTQTASIENWLGNPEVSGEELVARFRRHAEGYAIATRFNVAVEAVRREGEQLVVVTRDGARYRARTVIYAAGKRYRRLGVPGEERFLGRGIAFCATCDAPLFRDKKVAIVGGGNSAFTAARDLLPFASEIHVINLLPDFQADAVLQRVVRDAPKVTLHPAFRVREFLGKDKLTGLRMAATEGDRERVDLDVDGVFLEIGLDPSSGPVGELLERTPGGEIPVDRDQATTVPGLFAAGDVTDERDKQIVTAAAAGAKAALSAARQLGK